MSLPHLARWLVIMVLSGAPYAALAQSDELDLDLGGSVEGEASSEDGADGSVDVQAQADAAEAPSETAGDELEPSEPVQVSDAEQAGAEPEPVAEPIAAPVRKISLYAAAGLGVGLLSFTRPTAVGVQHLPESSFAAAELLLRIHAWPHEAFSLETQLAYQTSLGMELEVRPFFALPERADVRVQRVELSVAPRLAFSKREQGVALAVPIGFALRSFFSEVHQYSVETHNLGSAFVRAEIIVPLGEGIALRGGPEAHWLMLVEPSLEREGAAGPGYGLGFQGAVQAAVGASFSVALAYHQLHSVIPAAARFEDTERFLTARFGGSL